MGLYKLCEHKGRARDRCEHGWWARYRHVRVSLEKWSNDEIKTKTKAEEVFDDLKKAVRAGTFDKRGAEEPRDTTPLTFRQFAEVYKERHVFAKGLAIGDTIDYRLRPIVDHFGDRPLAEIRTADVEDFIADLRKPHLAGRRKGQPTRVIAIAEKAQQRLCRRFRRLAEQHKPAPKINLDVCRRERHRWALFGSTGARGVSMRSRKSEPSIGRSRCCRCNRVGSGSDTGHE